jgi:hypothetical protein
MNDFHVVEVGDGLESLSDNNDSIALCEPSTLADSFKQFSTGCQFGDNVKVLGALEPFIESDNVWMIEPFEEVHFIIDHVFMAFDGLFGDDFDCDGAVGSCCFLDNAIPGISLQTTGTHVPAPE